MRETFDNFISIIESIKDETKPTIKMRFLGEADSLAVLGLSIYYHKLLPSCYSPRWNNELATDEDILTAVSNILSTGMYDAKSYYALPFKTQKVLYYMSNSNNLGLQAAHLHSSLVILRVDEIYADSRLTVNIIEESHCPRCGQTLNTDNSVDTLNVCFSCAEKLWETIQYRVGDFELYGTSVKDFTEELPTYKVSVVDGLYKFKYLDKAIGGNYDGMLPFVEYQNNIAILG